MKMEQTLKASAEEVESGLRARLYRYCLSLTRSEQDAEDLLQETLLKAETRRQRRGDHANPEALLLRIARNSWIDSLRRSTLYRDIMKQETKRCQELIQDRDTKSRERMAAAFHVLMRDLSPPQRSVLLLREVFGYSAAECAIYLETTEGAVKSLLYRARQALEPSRASGMDGLQRDIDMAPNSTVADINEMVEAYLLGDIERLLQLVGRVESEAYTVVHAISSHYAGSFGRSAAIPYGSWQGMEMRLVS